MNLTTFIWAHRILPSMVLDTQDEPNPHLAALIIHSPRLYGFTSSGKVVELEAPQLRAPNVTVGGAQVKTVVVRMDDPALEARRLAAEALRRCVRVACRVRSRGEGCFLVAGTGRRCWVFELRAGTDRAVPWGPGGGCSFEVGEG